MGFQLGIERALQTMAESAGNLSQALKDSESEIPWEEIRGMRNQLTHAYLHIDQDTIRDTIRNDLPKLDAAIKRMSKIADLVENAEQENAKRQTPHFGPPDPGSPTATDSNRHE